MQVYYLFVLWSVNKNGIYCRTKCNMNIVHHLFFFWVDIFFYIKLKKKKKKKKNSTKI
jgi:hypothetical protein